MSFGGYFGHILSLETIKSTYLLYNLVGIIYAPWVYTKRRQSAIARWATNWHIRVFAAHNSDRPLGPLDDKLVQIGRVFVAQSKSIL